jgi:predicted ester cyclase
MSAEEIKALVHRWYDRWNMGKAAALAIVDETCAADYVVHAGIGPDIHGLRDNKQDTSGVFKSFPDVHLTIDDLIVEGDKVATRWTLTGTHKGEFMDIPPSNKKVKIWGITIDRVAGGKFVESWVRYDNLGLMQQLGLVPAPEQKK